MAKAKVKKKWIKIFAPREFNSKVLGESILKEKGLIGRTVKISLYNLVGDMKKQNVNLGFVITDVKDEKASTELYKYYLSTSHLKRMVRKAKDKIDDSFSAETKDKIKLKIKPIMLTKKKTSNSVLTALRKKSREILSNYLKNVSFVNFVREIGMNRIQMKLKKELKQIYPLTLVEIRSIERVK